MKEKTYGTFARKPVIVATKLYNLIGYALLWFILIINAASGSVWIGEVSATLFLLLHLIIFIPRNKIGFLILLCMTFFYGLTLETIFKTTGALSYASDTQSFLAPLWIVFLYPIFAISCSLFGVHLKKYKVISGIIGFTLAPLVYYNAHLLGAATYPLGIFTGSLIIGSFWAITFPLFIALTNTCTWYDSKCPYVAPVLAFQYSSVFPVSREKLFAWHESPTAIYSLLPKNGSIEIIKKGKTIHVGEEAHVVIKLGPFSCLWVAKHTAYQKNYLFEDTQGKGPFSYWRHVHLFKDSPPSSSILCDQITFSMPLSRITHPLFGEAALKFLKIAFIKRHKALKRIITSENQDNK